MKSVRRPRPGRPRSTAAHTAILRAAIDLVREVGYDNVAMDAIATRAGVGKATVYRRWSTKEALIVEAIGWIMSAVPVPDTGVVERDLLALMKAAVTMYQDPATGRLLSGLVAAMARSDDIAHAMRTGFVATWRGAVRTALERGRKRGELRRGLDLELATDLLSAPFAYRFLITGGSVDESLSRAVVRDVLRGITPR